MGLGASFCWQHWQNRTRSLFCMKCAFHGHEWIYRNGIVEPANLSIYRISYSIERRFKCSGSIEAIQPYCLSEMHLKHSWWCEWQTVTIQNHGVVHVVFQGTDSLARTHFFGVNKHIHLAWLSWSSSRTRFILSSLLKVCWDTSFSHVSTRSVHQVETWISSNLLEVTGRFIFCQLLSRVNSLHFKEQVPCLNKAQLSFEGAGA